MVPSLIQGIVLGLSAGFAPGPLSALVVSQTLQHGKKEGIKVAFVPLLTDLLIIVVAVFVLARLAAFQMALGIISLVGGLFLLYLAYENFRITGLTTSRTDCEPQSFLRGTLVNVFNPSPYLFWLTVGAPTVVKAWATGIWAAAGFLGGFYTCLVGSEVFMAVLVASSSRLFAGRKYVYMMRVLGAVLTVFALLLFKDGLRLLGVVK